MTNERNQDPQDPTRDQPPPKQYATPRPGQSGDDPKKPRIPDQMETSETSEGDDENQIASAEVGYDEEASTRGATGRSSSDRQSTPSHRTGQDSASQKPAAGSSQSPGSGSRQPTGAAGSGKPSGSTPGGRSAK